MLSIICPVFNEQDNIEELYAKLDAVIDQPAEFIFVDDGSTDASYDRLAAIAGKDSRVRVIGFRRNFGQTAALNQRAHPYYRAPFVGREP
jgi:glycosyltransferase involved in cell wall biosynthesis